MSGMAGLFNLDGRLAMREDLEAMGVALAHRGGDADGTWVSDRVGLIHRTRWITPESRTERLPSECRGLAITSDTRLDNRDELARELGADPRSSDSSLIVMAYEKWGERCPEKLLGDFAFALWDVRNQRLFCARDHLGGKPFCYYASKTQFAFASETAGLLALREVPRRSIDFTEDSYHDDKARTSFRDIFRLPPASTLIVDSQGIRIREYWRLDPHRENRMKTREYEDAFRELFREAVRCRLRSAYLVGSTLSGGLDSSSVVCMARTLVTEPLRTYSAVSDDLDACPEFKFVRHVLASGPLRPTLIAVREAPRFSSEVHDPDPVDSGYLFIPRMLHAAAARDGVRVMLDGADGDVTTSLGYDYLSYVAQEQGWRAFFREWKGRMRRTGKGSARVLMGSAIGPRLPNWLQSILGLSRCSRHRSLRECHFSMLTSGFLPFGLELYDRSAARFGIEARHPFFDKRLVEFCLALPADQKVFEGWTKSILRRAMRGLLPEAVRLRTDKVNLVSPFRAGLTESKPRFSFANRYEKIEAVG
jgi:asparagine synthase (glutamine-hydrolysing)